MPRISVPPALRVVFFLFVAGPGMALLMGAAWMGASPTWLLVLSSLAGVLVAISVSLARRQVSWDAQHLYCRGLRQSRVAWVNIERIELTYHDGHYGLRVAGGGRVARIALTPFTAGDRQRLQDALIRYAPPHAQVGQKAVR